MTLLVAMLLSGCTDKEAIDSEEPLPEGMGRLRIAICTPENNPDLATRAVNTATTWLDPDHEWERLHSFRILICNESNVIVDIIERTEPAMTAVEGTSYPYRESAIVKSGSLVPGSYKIYATANYADGYSVGQTVDLDRTVKLSDFNGYTEQNIPMSGQLGTTVNVTAGKETDAGTITVWRMVGKLQFYFTNNTTGKVQIKGIEVEPINQASATGPGIYLFSKDDLTSTNNLAPQYISRDVNVQNATVTWALHDATLQRTGVAAAGGEGLFSQAQLSWGYKLEATGQVTADDGIKLHKFRSPEKVDSHDEGEVVIFAVKPMNGLTFKPKKLSFTACRIGTDGGKFDVVEVSNGTTTDISGLQNITPNRYNGNKGKHEPPFTSSYEVNLTSDATTGFFCVKIYLKGLDDDKEYAFSDVVITGDLTNTEAVAANRGEGVTLPYQALTDVGPVSYAPTTALELAAANGSTTDEGTLFFYVNETDATYTTTENQLSVRFKIARQNGNGWYDDEIRFGLTTPYIDGQAGGEGFNVIRRNDWIHIPVVLRDWQFRVEPLAFVPIGGYPATLLSSDALTATFSTGGYIILQPFAQKDNDGIWRDFSDPEVQFVSLTWKNSDGTNVAGDGKILTSGFTYDSASQRITGVLSNTLPAGTHITTMTLTARLGPTGSQYSHAFTFNVILQK